MKKIKHRISASVALTLIVVMAMTVGCRKTIEQLSDTTQITVDAAISDTYASQQNAATKVDASGFVDGDKISFFAVKYSSTGASKLGLDAMTYLNNVLYQRENSFFKHFDGTNYIRDFFPNDGSSIDIYGLYPRTATIADFENQPYTVAVDQSADTNYFASDVMMAKTISIAPQAIPNKLLFQHLLAKVEVNVKLLNFATSVAVSEVRLLSIVPDTKVDLRAFDGTTTTVKAGVKPAQKIIPLQVTPATKGFAKTYTAIVPPQLLIASTALVEVVLNTPNNDVYTLKLSDNFQLQAGKKNVFDITVNFGSRPDIMGTGSIIAWTESSVDGGSVEKESDYKFKMVLINEKDSPSNTKSVKVGVNGNRTFDLTKIGGYVANSGVENLPAILFAFPGDGNRPGESDGEVKFTINRIELINAAGVKFNQCIITTPIEVKAKGEMILYYDMVAGTISSTKP